MPSPAAATMVATMGSSVASASTSAAWAAGKKAREEGMELRDALLGDVNGDRLIPRVDLT